MVSVGLLVLLITDYFADLRMFCVSKCQSCNESFIRVYSMVIDLIVKDIWTPADNMLVTAHVCPNHLRFIVDIPLVLEISIGLPL